MPEFFEEGGGREDVFPVWGFENGGTDPRTSGPFAALVRLRDIIRESFIAEMHPDYLKGEDGRRSPANGINDRVKIAVLYGYTSTSRFPMQVKTTLKQYLDV